MPITINDHCRSLKISGAAGCSLAKREPGMCQAPVRLAVLARLVGP
jgi:hypothetical protein